MKIYEIDPGKWDRGRGDGANNPAVSLDGPGGMCCLGQVGVAEGLRVGGYGLPAECPSHKWEKLGLTYLRDDGDGDGYAVDTSLTDNLVRANDDPDFSDIDRIYRLNSILEEANADWRFKLKGAA
jgi:hypothetical protein